MHRLIKDMADLENTLIEELINLQANKEAKVKYPCANKSKFWVFWK